MRTRSHSRPPGRTALLAWSPLMFGSALLLCDPGNARAQSALQRNLPPAEQSPAPKITVPNAVSPEKDSRPLAGPLRSLAILGPQTPVAPTSVAGVDTHAVARLDNDAARRRLARFLGRPISHQLISRIQTSIAQYYRRRGFPFVSVSTPEQAIDAGVLQLRVVEFHLGRVAVTGGKPPAGYIESRLREKPGQPIASAKLSEDLDWLNRYPFRTEQAVFAPGSQLGETVLNFVTTQSRPFRIYGGYADSGSPSTGWDRYFAGALVALPVLHDATLSYQFTGSSNFFDAGGDAFGQARHPQYMSHAVRLTLPTLPRQDLELTTDYVESNVLAKNGDGNFTSRFKVYEAVVGYRSALSNFTPLSGDVVLGFEAKRQFLDTIFITPIASHTLNVEQIYTEYSKAFSDPLGASSVDLTVHISPGGVGRHNTDAAFTAFGAQSAADPDVASASSRLTSSSYAYAIANVSRSLILPFGLSYSGQLFGQYSQSPLPLTEQMGFGGQYAVRGYSPDDGSYDRGAFMRNELRLPRFAVESNLWKAAPDAASPYVFFDAGYGHDNSASKDHHAISAGLGADYGIGPLVANLDIACPLDTALSTRAGDLRLEVRATASF